LIAVLWLPGKCAFAASCSVVKHRPPTEADKALLAADFVKAASLYQSDLASHPGDAEATIGLVHALLRQQKVEEVADAVKVSLAAAPDAAALISLRGEVELRQGAPWIAGQTAVEAEKLDPCNPRIHLLLGRLEQMSSLYATSRKQIDIAHRLDPTDPEIRGAWIRTLPRKEKITEIESYLSAPTGIDEEDTRHWKMYLDSLKKAETEPHKACHLVSSTASAEIPFALLLQDLLHPRGFGLDVKLNGRIARLEINTGASGLLITRLGAERTGLKPFSQTEIGGIGDKGYQPGYTAYVDSIRIGNLEFQDCAVRVLDSKSTLPGPVQDGLIGMDVFSQFLVTLDYPARKLLLGSLPPRPGESKASAPALRTSVSDQGNSDESGEPDKPTEQDKPVAKVPEPGRTDVPVGTKATTTAQNATSAKTPHGPYDRYIAPEMQSYTPVYRAEQMLILPAALNGEKLRLFILDTGAFVTTISPQAAREVTKVRADD
jgi:predicted aspartyl protease